VIPQPEKELRLKGSEKILNMIRNFSATEKVIFGLFVILMAASAIILVSRVNDLFLVAVPAHGGQLDEGVVGLPRLVNPVLAFTDTDRDLSALVYAGLLKYENGELVPDLAQSYSVSPDGLTYTFTLKPDLQFQDGTPLTADDVVFTVQAIQNTALKSPLAADWSNISVSELSPTQIQFVLKQPYAPFLSNTTVGILPKHIWNNVSTNEFIFSEYNVNPIGAGPYEVKSIARNSSNVPTSYTLTSWSDYQGGEAYISNIIIHFFSDEKSAVAAYEGGTIDSISGLSPDDAGRIASTTATTHIVASNLPHIFGVFFNQNQQSLFADSAVRQALNVGINRNLIVNQVFNGYGTPINSPIPVGILATSTSFNPNGSTTAAMTILTKDGWTMGPNGVFQKYNKKTGTTTLAFSISTSDSPNLTQTANILKQEWANMGVQVTVNIYQQGDLNQNVIAPRKYDALLFGESFGKVPDLYAFWDSTQRNSPGLNIAMYVNASADKILEAARASSDPAVRLSDYAAFNQIIANDMPAAFLYSPDFIYAMPEDVKGSEDVSTDGAITSPSDRWDGVSKWYIDTDNVWKGLTQYAEPKQK
jgi:peptide/nickel transport system substrate-binding protein